MPQWFAPCTCVCAYLWLHAYTAIRCIYVTGLAKTGHVGTNYTLSLWRSYLSTGTQHFHSVTSIIMPNTFAVSAESFIAIECRDKKLWVQKDWKSRQNSCAHMPCFRRSGHRYNYMMSSHKIMVKIWWAIYVLVPFCQTRSLIWKCVLCTYMMCYT